MSCSVTKSRQLLQWLACLLLPLACAAKDAPSPTDTVSAAAAVPPATAVPVASAEPRATTTVAPSPSVEANDAFATQWSGSIHLSSKLPSAAPPRLSTLVIRDQAAFESLIASLPTHRIAKKQPAPLSDDPLLNKPAVDWQTKMVLVAIRGDSMYVQPRVHTTTRDGDALVVTVVLPPLGDSVHAAAQLGVGTYHAVVIDRFDGPVRFVQ